MAGRNRRAPCIVRRGLPHRLSWRRRPPAAGSERLHDHRSIGAELARHPGLRASASARLRRARQYRVRTGGRCPARAHARPSRRGHASATSDSDARASTPTLVAEPADHTRTDRAARFCNSAHGDRPDGSGHDHAASGHDHAAARDQPSRACAQTR